MENDIVDIDAANTNVIFEQKLKIEQLFDVELVISGNEENSQGNEVTNVCKCRVVAKSQNAQKSLDKAKRYICALTGSGPEFIVVTENYDVNIVQSVLQYKSDLERECSVNIAASPGMSIVSISGHRHDVVNAKKFVDHLSMEQNQHDHNTSQPSDDFVNIAPMNGANSYLKQNSGEVSYSNDSDDYSSDDDAELEIKNMPDYWSKLEFANKLGYGESELVEALRSLDAGAGPNELLSELIKNSALRNEGKENESGENWGNDNKKEDGDWNGDEKKTFIDNNSGPYRHVIMDGSNLAMSHGNKETFSCMGIKLAVDWFKERGHTAITVFVPQWRKETSRSDARIKDQQILNDLEKEKILVFTPSRRIGGKRVVCYDDRYILKLAVDTDGIVVSNDNYRDLIGENDQFKKVVEERLLMYSFVNDRFMPPDDPLGRNGPTLDNFLLKEPAEPEPLPPPCPYGSKKCTYGNKCKYYHPERRTQPHKTVTEKLAEQAKQRMLEMRRENSLPADGKKKLTRTKTPLQRTQSGNPEDLRKSEASQDTSDRRKDNTMDEYNQKLSESLMRMELDRALSNSSENVKVSSPRREEKRDFSPRPKVSDQAGRSSPRFTELRQKGRNSPRESSPVNLVVPGLSDQPDDGQKFLSGHLLLAKKLSDEANESDKLKKKTKSKDSIGSPSAKTQLAFTASEPQKQANVKKQPLSRTSEKQKLARQLSLQGGEDPRLSQGRVPLHAQLSYDPRRLMREKSFPTSAVNPAEQQKILHDFMRVQRQDSMTGDQTSSFVDKLHQARHMAQDFPHGHTALSRMQSAPEHCLQGQPTPRQPRTMMRQNSSSDTQLNKMYHFESDIQMDGMAARGPSGGNRMDPATFQICRQTSQNMPHFQPMCSTGQSYAPSPLDYRFQSSMSPDFQHQGSQFHSSNPMLSQQQEGFNQVQSQYHFSPFVGHSNVWSPENPMQPNFSNFPPPFINSNLSQQNTQMQDVNLPPTNSTTVHGQIQPFPSEPSIQQDRLKIYASLCSLFPEESVRMVMNQHPEECDPKTLCAYLVHYN